MISLLSKSREGAVVLECVRCGDRFCAGDVAVDRTIASARTCGWRVDVDLASILCDGCWSIFGCSIDRLLAGFILSAADESLRTTANYDLARIVYAGKVALQTYGIVVRPPLAFRPVRGAFAINRGDT